MNDAILVTGASGQLGSELQKCCNRAKNKKFIFCDKNELDLTDIEKVEEFIVKNSVMVLINCAAFTNVENAEDVPLEANKLNHDAVAGLAELSLKHGFKILHISTDYVFGGGQSKPYDEGSKVDPLNVYGQSKSLGEQSLLEITPDNLIIRTAWFYSEYGNNFVKTIIRLAGEKDSLNVVTDQIGTPTCANDLAELIVDIILNNKIEGMSGIYHYSNEGVASWYDFAMEIVELMGLDCQIKPILSDEYEVKARRPLYSVLNKGKIKKELNIDIPYWRDSLRKFITRLV